MTITNLIDKIDNNEAIKLNLGVGGVYKEGFIGVDVSEGKYTDIVYNLIDISKVIPVGTVEEIYSRHVIEHFPRNKTKNILCSWVGLLKRGGKITLNFPDLDKYIDYYIVNKNNIPVEEFARWLYGNQSDDYDYHKAGFNGDYIAKILKECGMKILRIKPALVGNGVPPTNRAMIGTEILAVKRT